MVQLSRALLVSARPKKKKFIDQLRLFVQSGKGGEGKIRYGGQGGSGGNIFVVGDEKETLKKLIVKHPTKRFTAEPGQKSTASALLGKPGADLEIPVPPGVCVCTDKGLLLGEINKPEDRVLVAKGGEGGGPKNNFMPKQGVALNITLDLKLIADIGFVGFPNAGKSTLLKALSRAAPKIASYPFTTIMPQIGTMMYDDFRQITVADLPGLIEGAHINVGLGHNFLKHVERTSLLLFIVDTQGFRLGVDHPLRTAWQTVLLLNKELELYKPELLEKPAVLAINKMDLPDAQRHCDHIKHCLSDTEESLKELPENLRPTEMVKFDDVIPISAKNKDNTDELKLKLREIIDKHAAEAAADEDEDVKRDAIVQSKLNEHYGKHLL